MTLDAKTIYRKDYKSPGFLIDAMDLKFELESHETIVTNEMQLQNLDESKPLILDGEAITLLDISLDDTLLDEKAYDLSETQLTIHKTPKAFKLKIRSSCKPHENTQLSGLYQSGKMYCTQCEAEGFRRITFYLDRPDVLTTYTTTIVASQKEYPILLSNGNLVEKGQLDGGRHWVKWHDPFPKPSYLFALVAGDLACIEDSFTTMSGREVDLKLYVEHGAEDKTAHAMTSLKKSMKWDEEIYGREYDLDIFMIVAVSDFNMGAMENKGLNIFNSKYVLAKKETATDDDFADIEGVVAHEYFHNWTGNRVTCRDWFQLSLKEGLTVFRDQEFSRDMNSRDVNRIKDVDILRRSQFPEDAGPMAHPVRPDEYIEINNFYTSTIYNKGAEVIRMQHTILGAEGFRRGMDLYFERHDGQAVTIDDFVSAMEDANDVDFEQLKRWYSQAGTPEIRVRQNEDSDFLSLSISQYCSSTPNQEEKLPFYIPIKIAVFDRSGEKLPIESDLFTLKEEKQTLELKEVPSDAILSLGRGFSAPVKFNFKQSIEDLEVLAQHETDGFARFEAMQSIFKHYIEQVYASLSNGESPKLPASLMNLFERILINSEIKPALKAFVLTLPSFESVSNAMKGFNPIQLVDAIDYTRESIGRNCINALKDIYKKLVSENLTEMVGEHYGKRHLKNVCLGYLEAMSLEDDFATEQFENAQTMTDELAAFKCLVKRDKSHQQQAQKRFYDKWKHDELVLDKWFSTLALSQHDGVFELLETLLAHEAFELTNPNKVRALVGSFAMGNIRKFNSSEGYAFLSRMVSEVDKVNPQTAARLVVPLTYWRRLDESHGQMMKAELDNIIAKKEISKDLYEMVKKALS